MANTTWTRNHVLSLADFTPDEYNTVLQTAASFSEVRSRRTKKVSTLLRQVSVFGKIASRASLLVSSDVPSNS